MDDTDGLVSRMMEDAGAPAAVAAAAVADAASTETPAPIRMRARDVDVFYADKQALFDVDIDLALNKVTALIGPSGCGKSTFLRCLNRMNDIIDICRVTGSITLDDRDIYGRDIDVVQLRARVGMVFQKPNPFPKSIYENVAYGPRIHGLARKAGSSTTSSSGACGAPASSTRSPTGCSSRAPASPAGSSSGFASPAPSPSAPR